MEEEKNGRGWEIPEEACGGERKRSGAERKSAGRRHSGEPAARGSLITCIYNLISYPN